MENQTRISRIIEEYDAQGWHRTGTETDRQSGIWLAEWIRRCGLEPVLEKVALDRIDPLETTIRTNGITIEGLPLFDGGDTGSDGVSGRLGVLGSDAPIAVVEVPIHGPAEAFENARRGRIHKAIIAVTEGPRPGLGPRNADAFTAPNGPPVLQVDSGAGQWLREQATLSAEASVVVHIKRNACEAWNITATLRGRVDAEPPLVVITPRSGWWNCAAERGGGLAVWLEVMRSLNEGRNERTVHFLASTGHELGHLGLVNYLAQRPEWIVKARAWLHLGASIGASQEPSLTLQASDKRLEDQAQASLEVLSSSAFSVAPPGAAPRGESRNLHQGGGRYITLAGRHALFHLPSDRWPEAVDIPLVASFATVFASLASSLAEP